MLCVFDNEQERGRDRRRTTMAAEKEIHVGRTLFVAGPKNIKKVRGLLRQRDLSPKS